MKFSIIIPLYNGANMITATLDTVIAQTYKDYEVIMVNDGSPDNVGSVVRKYINDHPQIKFVYIEQKNKGLGGARNTAMKNATGDIIAILDQDDVWYPEKLAKVADVYKNHPDVSIVVHNQYLRANGAIQSEAISGPYEKDMYRKLLFVDNCLSTSATTFKRVLLEDVGYFSEEVNKLHFVEDYDLWLRMAAKGYKFHFMPKILGEYVLHESNNSSDVETIYRGALYVIEKHYALLPGKKPLDWYRMRRKKAEYLYYIAHYYILNKGEAINGLFYLFRSIAIDPLWLIKYISKKLWERVKLKMEGK